MTPRLVLYLSLICLMLGRVHGAVAADRLLVFAAASVKTALDEIAEGWRRGVGVEVSISYAGSPALARQIENGAPADLFISADHDWMDHLDRRGLVRRETRGDLLANRLVLVAPAGVAPALRIAPEFPLAAALGDGRLAMANVDSVPAGKYGRAALERLGVWTSVRHRTVQAENVRAAALYVSRKEAPLGIVYRTDALADPRLAVVDTFPADSHPPILYPAALVATSRHPRAMALLDYLRSDAARAAFERQGFTVLPGS